jgi:putative transposase
MAKWKYRAEEIVTVLRQVEVRWLTARPHLQACRESGIAEQTYYRWRKEYAGLKLEQTNRLDDLDRENSRLRRLAAELSLEKQILQDVARRNL